MGHELFVQRYLRVGKTPTDLQREFGVRAHEHPSLPLVGFSYSQIDSPKTHPIVMDCRGLCLEQNTWDVVALPFRRFFNLGEALEITGKFDWDRFDCLEKHDGTLMILFFYRGSWRVKTRGSFADSEMLFPRRDGSKVTYAEMFWDLLPRSATASLDEDLTYCFEMCSLQNKVVRVYDEPGLYLLAMFSRVTHEEVYRDRTDPLSETVKRLRQEGARVALPESHRPVCRIDVDDLLRREEGRDAGREGFVLRDANGLRLKVKTDTYRSLHKMHNNGFLLRPKGILPLVLRDERSTVEKHFPEALPLYDAVKAKVDEEWEKLCALWLCYAWEPNQKKFAMAVKENPFCHVLFHLRKERGDMQKLADLREAWLGFSDYIGKVLFG